MSTPILLGILVLLVVGGVVAYLAIAPQQNVGGATSTTTNTSTKTSTETPTTSHGTVSSGSVNITGAWHGVYQGIHGSGRWAWRIWSVGENSYRGLLRTDGTYSSGNESIPITIQLQGNHITIGAVSLGVVFTGTINGGQASGTWRFTNNMDSGTWSGSRGVIDLTPPENMSPTTTSMHGSTTSNANVYDQLSEMSYPPGNLEVITLDLKNALTTVKEGAKLVMYENTSNGLYGFYVVKQPITNGLADLNSIVAEMTTMSYTVIMQPIPINETTASTMLSIQLDSTSYTITLLVDSGESSKYYVYFQITPNK